MNGETLNSGHCGNHGGVSTLRGVRADARGLSRRAAVGRLRVPPVPDRRNDVRSGLIDDQHLGYALSALAQVYW
jgi:hypothetical protein